MTDVETAKKLFFEGLGYLDARKFENAESRFIETLKLTPRSVPTLNNLAIAQYRQNKLDDAALTSKRAIEIDPLNIDSYSMLATCQTQKKLYAEALAVWEKVISLNPNSAHAHCNRGVILKQLYKYEDALASLDRAIAIEPQFSDAYLNRGNVLKNLQHYDDALVAYNQALSLTPDLAEALIGRGSILYEYNLTDNAIADYQRAIAVNPNEPVARFATCFAQLPILYEHEKEIVERRERYEKTLRVLVDDVESQRLQGDLLKAVTFRAPFHLAYQNFNDRDLQQLYGSMVCRIMERKYPPARLPAPPKAGEPVRVGIVSGFFRLHSNWKIPMKGWMTQLDRRQFKIFGYHVGKDRDAETDVAAALCDRFVDRALDAEECRREILADAPHVLIYPGLFMDDVSMVLAAQRLAPVQCNSWGHPETSGMPTLDYFLSSDLMEPPDAAGHYTERLVRLPNISIFYEPVRTETVALTRDELGLRPDATVFWSGQSLFKYLPQFDYVFPSIAKETADCQFVFIRHSGAPQVNLLFQERLNRAFAAFGLKASDHCIFLPHLNLMKFVGAIGLSDIFLDSIPWSGCNSTLESLSHNLPIVTLRGGLMRSRHSAAILQMIGIQETITDTIDDYISSAARLANHPDERKALSQKIANNKHRVYRDRDCISALNEFLSRVVRQTHN
jgi:predicted O-linked N-acetylglucosamine transferase (SPINDLY family)